MLGASKQERRFKVQRPRFEEIERMEENEEGQKLRKEIAKQEFAKRKASFHK